VPVPVRDAEHIGVQSPERGQPLTECSAKQSIPGARPGLEFRFKTLAKRVYQARFAGWRLETEQQSSLGFARQVVQEPYWPSTVTSPNPECLPRYGCSVDRTGFLYAFEDAGAAHEGEPHRDREIVGDTIGERHHPAFNDCKARGRRCRCWRAMSRRSCLSRVVFDEQSQPELALLHRSSANRGDSTRAADATMPG